MLQEALVAFGIVVAGYVGYRFGAIAERRSWLRMILEADRIYFDREQKWARVANVANRLAAELGYDGRDSPDDDP